MKVGWLLDDANYTGGAELTMAEFAAAAPEGVELVECPAGGTVSGLDRYVIGNCVTYTLDDLARIDAPATKYWHDVGPHVQPQVRQWLDRNAQAVCCSPIQAEYMGLRGAFCIPPPIDLGRFERAALSVNGDRAGAVSVAQWRNLGKAPQRVIEWGQANGGIAIYGDGVFAPQGSQPVPYEQMPELLAHYEVFVFLPSVIEPFGRLVAEAWASGCRIVTNGLVGARYWIEEQPEAIERAGESFWRVVLA